MTNIGPKINTYSRHLATINGHKIYLADFPAEKDNRELTLANSCRFLSYRKSILSCVKEHILCYGDQIPRGARFFVYFVNYQTYEIWSRDYK